MFGLKFSSSQRSGMNSKGLEYTDVSVCIKYGDMATATYKGISNCSVFC